MKVPVEVEHCDDCPYAKVEKVYTADSFDNVRRITCTELNTVVHSYLDWYDKSDVPSKCPFKKGE